jgi:hypothetical protein
VLSPFDSQLQTLVGAVRRSHSCQDGRYAAQQRPLLFDHLVGDDLQRERHLYAQRLCGFQVDD